MPLVLGGQQPGREILYPVATVILGGLVTSTFCEFLIHPGLFWRFSGKDADRLATAAADELSTHEGQQDEDARVAGDDDAGGSAGVGLHSPPSPKSGDKEKEKEKGKDDDHDHHEPGPHGGVVVDWGKYHAEVCFDRAKNEATVYVLGQDEKTPAPIKSDKLTLTINEAPFKMDQVELKPSPQKGDPEGARRASSARTSGWASRANCQG